MKSRTKIKSGFLAPFLLFGRQPLFHWLILGVGSWFFTGGDYAKGADVLIPTGAIWRYLDTGVNQGTAWRLTNFNDNAWATGPAELGSGDGGEATLVNIGPVNGRYPTIYFRHTFVVTNRESITNVALRLLRDDGGVVYLNEVEILRSNMPDAPVTHASWSAVAAAGTEENAFFVAAVPPALLRGGSNVIAVEIHQADIGSSDLSFNFQLLANTPLGNLPPQATLSIAPGSLVVGAREVFTISFTASDADGAVLRTDLMQDGVTIRTFFGNAGTLAWSNAVAGIHEYTVRATDAAGIMGTSPPVRLLVTPPGLQAQSTFFPQFPSASGLVLQSAATVSSNVLHLNQATGGSRGAAWMTAQQGIASGFFTEFWFRLTARNGGGADGFSFIISGTPQPNIGSGGLSYGGITNSLAVEFDTWMNTSDGDLDDRHIGVHSRGALANSLNETASLGGVTPVNDFTDDSGMLHKVRIFYVPGRFLVFLDNFSVPVIDLGLDLRALLSLPTGTAWLGLAGGTGASWEYHDIKTWSHTSFANVPPVISLTSPAQALRLATGSDVVLTAEAHDPDGTVLGVEFYDGSENLGLISTPPYRLVWTNPPAGIHIITALTADADFVETISEPRVIEILPANANVFLYPNFSAGPNLLLQSSAAFVSNRVRLTPAISSQLGGLWLDTRQMVAAGFETVFQFQVSQPGASGGDGFAFVILNSDSPSLGTSGAGLGYQGLSGSLAVEFDLYQNPEESDPDGNHLAIHSRGIGPNSSHESAAIARATPLAEMSDAAIHTAVIRLDHGILRVFLDDMKSPLLKAPVDLSSLLNLPTGTAWVGFTSATGTDYENHDLLMWSFRPNQRPTVDASVVGSAPFFVPTELLVSAGALDSDGEIEETEAYIDGVSIGATTSPPFTIPWIDGTEGTHVVSATAVDDFGATAQSIPFEVTLLARPRLQFSAGASDGSIELEFATIDGQSYRVQYSGDLAHWTDALPAVIGTGAMVAWRDNGPPGTDSPPATQPRRFYRVVLGP
jgi:hypothetical protein